MRNHTISTIQTEMSLRTIFDGMVGRRAGNFGDYDHRIDRALVVSLQVNIYPDEDNAYDQRNIRFAIHLLRHSHVMLMAVENDWLFPKFGLDRDWEFVSPHRS